jgi:hypothetical protein
MEMKKFFRAVLYFFLFTTISLYSLEKKSLAAENFLTVTFKPDLNEKYINILTLMTGTKIINKVNNNIYNLKMSKATNYETVQQYTNLFSLIPEVVKVVPSQNFSLSNKVKAGQIIPGVILVRFKKITSPADINRLDKKYNTKTELLSATLNLYKVKLPVSLNVENAIKLYSNEKIVEYAEADRVMTIQKNGNNFIKMNAETNIPDLVLTFKPGSEDLAVNLFNLVYNTNLVPQKNSNVFIYKLNGNNNPDTTMNAIKLCPYVVGIKILQRNN